MKPGGFNLKTPEACLTILMTKNSQDFFKIMFVPLFKVVKGVFFRWLGFLGCDDVMVGL